MEDEVAAAFRAGVGNGGGGELELADGADLVAGFLGRSEFQTVAVAVKLLHFGFLALWKLDLCAYYI